MPRMRVLNGVGVPFTAEEEAARDADEVAYVEILRSQRVAEVKAEAARRVALVVPPDEALANAAIGVALLDKGKANWTAEDTALAQDLRVKQAATKALRDKAKALIVSLQPMTFDQLKAFDAKAAGHWQ